MKDGLPGLTIVALLALLVAVPFLYFGAYYVMLVGRQNVVIGSDDVDFVGAEKPLYSGGGERAEWFFSIANAIDMHLRPDAWEKEHVIHYPPVGETSETP